MAILSILQGFYYLVTGVWPLVDIGSFQAVTGPKNDLWLVHTVGVLVAVIGAVLLLAGFRRRVTTELAVLAVGSAVGLTGIDVFYVSRGVIADVYLGDALAELILVVLWLSVGLYGMLRQRVSPPASAPLSFPPPSGQTSQRP
jgi:hypothetical protein